MEQGSYQNEYAKNNYSNYLSSLPLSALQKQLIAIKDKQKQFYKLNYQLKLLQKKSKLINQDSKKYELCQDQLEDEQISQLKAEIQGVNHDIKNIGQQSKNIKKQCKQSKLQLKQLEETLQSAKQKNYAIINQVNMKKQKLMQKDRIIQQLKDSQLNSQKYIYSLRSQIKQLEVQSHKLEDEIDEVRVQKQQDQMNKQRLRKIMQDLQHQINQQRDHQRQTHYKLTHVKDIRKNLEEQLLILRKQEEQLGEKYEEKLEHYHNAGIFANQSELKIKNLKDELFVVECDIEELNQEFIREGQLLKKQEIQNTQINQQFDAISKQALDVWHSICDLIKIKQKQFNYETKSREKIRSTLHLQNDCLIEQNRNQVKFKSLKIWKEIEQIIKGNCKQDQNNENWF